MKPSPTREQRGATARDLEVPGQDPARFKEAIQGLVASVNAVQDHFIAVAAQLRSTAEAADGLKDWDGLLQSALLLEQVQNRAEALSAWTDPSKPASGPGVGEPLPMADPDRPLTGAAIGTPVTLPLGLSLQKLERFWILSTLEALDGNRSLCARHLDVALRTVVRKLSEFKALGHPVPAAVPGRRRRSAAAPVSGTGRAASVAGAAAD